jgi:hypothetical protein
MIDKPKKSFFAKFNEEAEQRLQNLHKTKKTLSDLTDMELILMYADYTAENFTAIHECNDHDDATRCGDSYNYDKITSDIQNELERRNLVEFSQEELKENFKQQKGNSNSES